MVFRLRGNLFYGSVNLMFCYVLYVLYMFCYVLVYIYIYIVDFPKNFLHHRESDVLVKLQIFILPCRMAQDLRLSVKMETIL